VRTDSALAISQRVLNKQCPLAIGGAILLITFLSHGAESSPPDDFPHFQVPGHEQEMATLRDLFWLHYPGAGPKATLWDEWLTDASLWPAVTTGGQADAMRHQWSETFGSRIIDPEGYVATHQHASIAHQLGWPFPFWNQGRHGCGWHFSFKNTAGQGWRPNDLSKTDGWTLGGARPVGVEDEGWHLEITNANAVITAPPWKSDTFEMPFLQLRSRVAGLGDCQPFIEWTTPADTNFNSSRRMYFEPPKPGQIVYTMVPMYRHPMWTGEVAQLRIGLGNGATGDVVIQAFFSQYDTRHNINGQNFVRGCAKYFWWTGDLNFLRANLARMRTALRYIMVEHHALQRKVVYTTWIGHDGRSGVKRSADGRKDLLTGVGIGNNYWDILPFGNLDCYATIQYYDAVLTMAAIERDIRAHPEWGMPLGVLAFEPDFLEKHAAEVKTEGNRLFWNPQTGRFVACIDSEGQSHDYGFTFLNCEAIYYDFAEAGHARSILAWLDGERVVDGDTSQGKDIYHWRFGPRATTRRNVDWYFWAWSNPETIAWGGQVQDGGAVLGFAYHDLMARLKVLGPDNAWKRLQETLRWFSEAQAAGGYRKYYNGSREGSLQGAGTPGGLGCDAEFFESALVPQVMLFGFLGFHPRADGFDLAPRLPAEWPEFTLDRIRFHDSTLTIKATVNQLELTRAGDQSEPLTIRLPPGRWEASSPEHQGQKLAVEGSRNQEPVRVSWSAGTRLILKRSAFP
jgi:hypothetical protein